MSSTSSDVSQASTKVSGDDNGQGKTASRHQPPQLLQRIAQRSATSSQDVLLFLIAFRLLNALAVRTFFQPDEYFQSLEPAWEYAFGSDSGAWITWEWKNHLRSAIHPVLFGLLYRALDSVATFLCLTDSLRAELLIAGPKTLQAFLAASGDYYTWKVAENIYGKNTGPAWAALLLTVVSPWQWFCSTRTLSNSLETTLTIVALYTWPWHWSRPAEEDEGKKLDANGLRIRETDEAPLPTDDELARLVRALLLAAVATILRPTNILIWISLVATTFFSSSKVDKWVKIPWFDQHMMLHFTAWKLVPTPRECRAMLVESLICGGLVLLLSAVVDRFFYDTWTLPAYNFLYFNVAQSLAVFYGSNDWHYYLSQGYPLLLTTALPFTIAGLYQIFMDTPSFSYLPVVSRSTLYSLAITSLTTPAVLSLIAHKEVRFIYPILPALHIITALPLHTFFGPTVRHLQSHPRLAPPNHTLKKVLAIILLSLNALIAFYTSTTHNSGLIAATSFLRHEFTSYHAPNYPNQNMTAAFLMPCHSTPWRSHIQFTPTSQSTGIQAWALTCEPPLHLPAGAARKEYKDEADDFYEDPGPWLRRNMVRGPPPSPSTRKKDLVRDPRRQLNSLEAARNADMNGLNSVGLLGGKKNVKRSWPDYLIFFEQLEPVLDTVLRGSGYKECLGGRIFNSHWHDDWRRQGDVLVWCIEPERQKATDLLIREREKRELKKQKGSVKGELEWLRLKRAGDGGTVTGFTLGKMDPLAKGVGDIANKAQAAGRKTTENVKGNLLSGGSGPWGIGFGSNAQKSSSSATQQNPLKQGAQKAKTLVSPVSGSVPNALKEPKDGSGHEGGWLEWVWPVKVPAPQKKVAEWLTPPVRGVSAPSWRSWGWPEWMKTTQMKTPQVPWRKEKSFWERAREKASSSWSSVWTGRRGFDLGFAGARAGRREEGIWS